MKEALRTFLGSRGTVIDYNSGIARMRNSASQFTVPVVDLLEFAAEYIRQQRGTTAAVDAPPRTPHPGKS